MTKKGANALTDAGASNRARPAPNTGRRAFIRHSAAWLGMPLLGSLAACGGGDGGSDTASTPRALPSAKQAVYRLPAEDAPHASTYMAFASGTDGIWMPVGPQSTDAGIERVRADLMDVAKAIGATEPVDMLVLPADLDAARALLSTASVANPDLHARYAARPAGTGGINLVPVADGFNDFWVRDTGCLFVRDTANGNALNAVGFNFNGWGNANTDGVGAVAVPSQIMAASNRSKAGKFFQPFSRDNAVAGWMAQTKGVSLTRSTLTLEGGAIEFDGDGTAILTESSVLHVNRNPQLFNMPNGSIAGATLLPTARDTVLAELQRTLGVRKIIWLPGTATYPGGTGTGGAGGRGERHHERPRRFLCAVSRARRGRVLLRRVEFDRRTRVDGCEPATPGRSDRRERPAAEDRRARAAGQLRHVGGHEPERAADVALRGRLHQLLHVQRRDRHAEVQRRRGRRGSGRRDPAVCGEPRDRAGRHPRDRVGRRRHPLLDPRGTGVSMSRHIDIEIDSLSVGADFLNLSP